MSIHSTTEFTQDISTLIKPSASNTICLISSERYRVIHHTLKSGERLPSKCHVHASKILMSVEGSGKIQVDGYMTQLFEGQTYEIPFGQTHEVINTGKIPMKLIELRTGAYVDDDDLMPA